MLTFGSKTVSPKSVLKAWNIRQFELSIRDFSMPLLECLPAFGDVYRLLEESCKILALFSEKQLNNSAISQSLIIGVVPVNIQSNQYNQACESQNCLTSFWRQTST